MASQRGRRGDIAFLESHPEMIDRHDVTVVAAEAAAQQGFERRTPQHREATKEIFDRHLVLLRHEFLRGEGFAITELQHGHRGRLLTSAPINRRRMVAIEFGM